MDEVRPPTGRCRAGVARRDITPSAGIYNRNWGAALHDTALGIHRPFTVTALCLADAAGDDGPPLTLLALDLGWFGATENADFLSRVCAAAGLPPERLVAALSHTHAGPNLYDLDVQAEGGDLLRPYFERVVAEAIAAVAEARAALTPAWLTVGVGRCGLAAHRDLWDEAGGQWVCGYNPAGPVDDAVLVGRLTTEAGGTLATLVNYGCHPTTLGPENRLLSPDYIGAMREVVEGRDGAPVLFLLGACGEVGPVQGFTGDAAVADRNGRALGHAAVAALEGMPPPGTTYRYDGPMLSGATLGIWQHAPLAEAERAAAGVLRAARLTVDLPLRPRELLAALEERHHTWAAAAAAARLAGDRAAERDATAEQERARRRIIRTRSLPAGDTRPTPLWLWQIGDAILVAVPAEPYAVLQAELRRRFPDRAIFISVVTNGSVSYLLPRALYGSGLYQDWVSVVGPGGLEAVIEAAADQIAAWERDG